MRLEVVCATYIVVVVAVFGTVGVMMTLQLLVDMAKLELRVDLFLLLTTCCDCCYLLLLKFVDIYIV